MSEPATSQDAPLDSGDGGAASTSAGIASETGSDEDGHPTLRALLSLDGQRLVTLLRELGYEHDDDLGGWAKGDASSFVGMVDMAGNLDEAEVMLLSSGNEGVCRLLQVSRYESAREAFAVTAVGIDALDEEFVDDDTGVAVVTDGDEDRYLVLVSALGTRRHSLAIFDEPSIASGLLDRLGDGEYGETLEGSWQALAGRPLASSREEGGPAQEP